ncbi:MAG: hypothetical protein KDB61_01815, partial [Planctomycetes bacterium]|nr:hypothetical protein [Planctomycetota bacterium]
PLRGWHADLGDTPDLAPPLVALAGALALGHFGQPVGSRFSGLGTLQGKESPRLEVLTDGLRRLGLSANFGEDWIEIPAADARVRELGLDPVVLDAAGDHRMAFAFGLLSLVRPSIRVLGPDCVAKSWPGFWSELEGLRADPASM